MRWILAAAAALLAAWAQTADEKPAVDPTLLENSGKPMSPKFQCTDEDIQSFGLTCTEEEPCPIYLELSAFEVVGNQYFVAGNIHTSTNTLYSVLLASSDAGKTWREPFQRVRGASLDRILFVGFENGWVTGQIVNPLARDPFLLITSDGGKNWRRQPVFGDSRPGSIQQIWFDSRTTGNLVFDGGGSGDGLRYELYESATGGDNWMVREASDQPLRIKRMPPAVENSGWRLHADAASKSNRLEKKQGNGWAPAASFAVTIGSCKPAPVKEQEPPPPETEEPKTAPPVTDSGTLSLPALRGEPPKRKK
ncbi:MAG TPA: hypothetical protein VL285_14960 [Bryobacteraceae bacterium]|nr:hypothetical protein [Bryobacteraceae bacterium]